MPKEQVVSYAMGTCLVFETENPVKLKEKYVLGERRNEGYGQILIYNLEGKNDSSLKFEKYEDSTNNAKVIEKRKYKEIHDETRAVLNKSIKKVIKEEIMENTFKIVDESYEKLKINNTTIGRVLLMLKESKNYDEFDRNVKAIKDDKKLEKVVKIIENKENLYSLDSYKLYIENAYMTKKNVEIVGN